LDPPSGGGFGNPHERDSEKVKADVRDELVSAEEAERAYGVPLIKDDKH
jgi:N-methylhydantoinase B/oxoprolinase/acetone carboxylase alpha subunit